MKTVIRRAAAAFVLSALTVVATAAGMHEVTFKGTVVSADAKVVKVTVINDKTKKPEEKTFWHDAETKILRGDQVVTFSKAGIQKGEKIAVTINHDDLPDFALVIRLDEKK